MSKIPNKEEKDLFVSAILSNPGLSIKDREKVLMLLTRDMEDEIKAGIKEIVAQEIESISRSKNSKKEKKTVPEWIHAPQKVNSFLLSFSSDRSDLKYSVHDWEDGEFGGFKYDVFISRINAIKKDPRFLSLYYCNLRLYYALTDYLLSSKKKPGEFYWDKEGKIKVGLQYPAGVAQKWMSENPGHQLWDMPLSAIPEEYRPIDLYEGRQLEDMGNIRDLFKHVVEFRDDRQDFLRLIHSSFIGNADFHTVCNEEDFSSIRFYTFTTPVSNALMRVAENIRERSRVGADTVQISIEHNTRKSFELHIKHLGSFPDSRIDDYKIKNGTFASMRNYKDKNGSLLSVCDYYVIGRFKDEDGQTKTYKICYLYPRVKADVDGNPKVLIKEIGGETDGFKYIFKFYKNNAEENPNR